MPEKSNIDSFLAGGGGGGGVGDEPIAPAFNFTQGLVTLKNLGHDCA